MKFSTGRILQEYAEQRKRGPEVFSGQRLRVTTPQGHISGLCLSVSGKGTGRNALIVSSEKDTKVFRRFFLCNPSVSIEILSQHRFRKSKLYFLLKPHKARVLNKLI